MIKSRGRKEHQASGKSVEEEEEEEEMGSLEHMLTGDETIEASDYKREMFQNDFNRTFSDTNLNM